MCLEKRLRDSDICGVFVKKTGKMVCFSECIHHFLVKCRKNHEFFLDLGARMWENGTFVNSFGPFFEC